MTDLICETCADTIFGKCIIFSECRHTYHQKCAEKIDFCSVCASNSDILKLEIKEDESKDMIITLSGYNLTLKKSENNTKMGKDIYYFLFTDQNGFKTRIVFDILNKDMYGREIVIDSLNKISIISPEIKRRLDTVPLYINCYNINKKTTERKELNTFKKHIWAIENYKFSKNDIVCGKYVDIFEEPYTGVSMSFGLMLVSLDADDISYLGDKGFTIGKFEDIVS